MTIRRSQIKDTKSIFGKRMREARLSLGLPQDKLGVMIGLDEQTASARMSRYENGIHAPAFSTAEKIATKLCIPVAYFYCPDDELAQLILSFAKLSAADQKLILEKSENLASSKQS